MPGATQAPVWGRALGLRFPGRAVLLSLLPLMAGCTTGALDLGRQDVDRTMVTGAIPPAVPKTSPSPAISGTPALLAALAGASADDAVPMPLAWNDPESGARGAVTHLAGGPGDVCRTFVTTRESFDGVGLYRGEFCAAGTDGWQIRGFAPL